MKKCGQKMELLLPVFYNKTQDKLILVLLFHSYTIILHELVVNFVSGQLNEILVFCRNFFPSHSLMRQGIVHRENFGIWQVTEFKLISNSALY